MNMDNNVLDYLKSDLVLMTQTTVVLVQSCLIETLKHLRPALIFPTEARDLITQKSKELSKVKDVCGFSAAKDIHSGREQSSPKPVFSNLLFLSSGS